MTWELRMLLSWWWYVYGFWFLMLLLLFLIRRSLTLLKIYFAVGIVMNVLWWLRKDHGDVRRKKCFFSSCVTMRWLVLKFFDEMMRVLWWYFDVFWFYVCLLLLIFDGSLVMMQKMRESKSIGEWNWMVSEDDRMRMRMVKLFYCWFTIDENMMNGDLRKVLWGFAMWVGVIMKDEDVAMVTTCEGDEKNVREFFFQFGTCACQWRWYSGNIMMNIDFFSCIRMIDFFQEKIGQRKWFWLSKFGDWEK